MEPIARLPRSVVNLKKLQSASRRLLVLPRDATRGRYMVASAHDSGRYYEVAIQREALVGHCTCQWAQYGGINCKHVLAALRASYAPEGSLAFWPSAEAARRQHRHVLAGEEIYATLRPHHPVIHSSAPVPLRKAA